jgi:hypothetical protein
MTPAEVEALAPEVYRAFVTHMDREATAVKRAAASRARGRH